MTSFRYKHGDRPLEGYTVQRAVGRGGFGEVYYALSDSGREVALKVIQGYEQIELRGVSACMNLKSPHLITIFDVRHNADGEPFVIMEYVSGPSLRELIDQSPAGVGTQKAAFFLREIAKGLTYLHDQGIVHRDLKPGNIFYEDGYVKIGDYGLSKSMSASVHSGQTVTVGTVHYMAPEIGQGRYDRGVDIYALGVVLYEMLTGQTPYLGASPGEVLMKHLAGEPDLTGIEEPFAAVIRKAMAKNPADRYQSAQEMVEAIFGAEHVRNSVSVFRPESLSVAAERVGQRVAVSGSGSSAEHTGARLGGSGPETAEAGGRDKWDEFGRRMDQFGRRMGEWGEQFGERVAQVGTRIGDRLSGRATPPPPPPPLPMPALRRRMSADPHRDPLDWNQRRLLGVLTAAVVAGGAGVLAGSTGSANPLWPPLFAFVTIAGAAGGIIVAQIKLAAKLAGESGVIQRLAFGGTAAVAGLLCCLPYLIVAQSPRMSGDAATWSFIAINPVILGALAFVFVIRVNKAKSGEASRPGFGRLIYIAPLAVAILLPLTGLLGPFARSDSSSWRLQKDLLATLLSGGIALFLVNWRRHTAAGRPERLSLGAAFWAALTAWIAAQILDGDATLAAGIMAGVALASQVLAPFDPFAREGTANGSAVAGEAAWTPAVERMVGQTPPPPAPQRERLSPPSPPPPAVDTFGGRVLAGQPHHPAGYGGCLLPSWARGLFLLAFALLSGTGIMLFCFAGIARLSEEEAAIAVGFGIGACMFAIFCLVRALKNSYRSWWSSFVRPVLMIVCVQAALMSILIMATDRYLTDDDTLIGLAFIVFPSILFIVLACIPDRTVNSLSASAVSLATPPYVPNVQGASTRFRLWALLLACIGFFFPVCGLHRFYVGKVGTGLIWLFTLGFLGIGTLVDVIMIVSGSFTDRHGFRLLAWQNLDELTKYPPASHPVPPPVPVASPVPVPTVEPPAAAAPPAPPAAWPQPVAAGFAPAPQPAPFRSPARPRGLTNPFLAAISSFVLLGGLILSLAAAIDLPAIVAAGFPDPHLAAQLQRDFGNYAGWPNLAERIVIAVAGGVMVLAMLLGLIARRYAGAAHVSRVILAFAAFLGCFRILTEAMRPVNWPSIVDMFNHNRVGAAMESLLDQAGRGQDWLMAGGLLLAGLILLGWPERRREPETAVADQPEVLS